MADQAIVERSCTKLRSAIGDDATNFTGDLQEMLDTLEDIQAAMPDTERSGKEWVKKARTAAYGVSDLVDELTLQSARTPAAGKMTKRVDLPEKMKEKMKEIKKLLKGVLKESIEFEVKNRASNPITLPPGAIVGRDKDIENIFAQLSARRPSEEPNILLVAGKENVGKTTVAEMVFNDVRFRGYSRVWVNNSYELLEIGKSIISQLSGKQEMRHGSDDDTDSITNRLHELLNGMKVLIVLCDLFMLSHEWEPLKQMFSVRDKGSQVIVVATTTQLLTDSHIQLYNLEVCSLEVLSEDMCCTIIKQLASRSEDRSTKRDLERIAPEIAKLCGGLPLAAQLFGRLLKFKHYEEWATLLDKSRWPEYNNPVDLSLELSFRSMPPNLRLCLAYGTFSYLAAQRRLVKEDLIHQWIALGLVEPSDGTICPIKLAEEYITRLLEMSFLQKANVPQASGKDDMGPTLFKMHDSILDFGYNVIRDDFEVVYGPDCRVTEHHRYVLIVECDAWPSESLLPARNIRGNISSINCILCSKMDLRDDSFSVPSCLRVLNLEKTSIQKLPTPICQLEQLGYLNLSRCSRLVDLPEMFGNLKNLLHINLSGCSELENLPESFGRLLILRHINLSGCSRLKTLPKSFGKLIHLVHVDLSGCCKLKNLQDFFLKLANLMHLNLSGLSDLETLPGSFGKLIKLVHINLSNCSGLRKLPQSFGKLTSLEHINLSSCSGLETLPKSFGDLRNLLHVDLSRCYGLQKLPESFGKLQKLEHIGLSGCSGLVTLPESFGGLTNLLHIDLSRCCRLSKLPESFKKLKKLVYLDLSFWSCFEGIQTALGGLTSLQHLNLSQPCCYHADHNHLEGLLEGLKVVFGDLSRLQYLNLSMLLNPISYSKSKEEICEYIGCIGGLYNLENLDLSHNIFLRDLPESLSGLYRLHTLDLSGCIRLEELGTWMTEMDSLKSLILRDCEGLKSYKFEVGVDNINNYVQLQEVTSEALEITCLEKMKCLEEAQRIKLEEKLKLQTLKLYWTRVKSVEENKRDRSAEENGPEGSVQEKKLDRSVEEIEHEVLVERNELNMSVGETEPKVSVEKNRCVEEIEEHEVSVERNEHEVSVEENKPTRSAEEIEAPEVSRQRNKTDRSAEEIEPEVSMEKNKTDKSAEEIEAPEVSGEKNKTDRPAKEIEEPEVSLKKNRPADSSVEENVLLGALKPPRNVRCLELHGYRGEICQPSWLLSEEKYSDHFLNLEKVIMEDFPSCKTLPSFGLLRNLQRLVVRRMASVRKINAGDLIGSNRPAEAKFTIVIDDMPSLEEFNTTYNSADKMFRSSAIRELVVHKCPCLRFRTAQNLVISECDQGMTSLGEKQQGYEGECPPEQEVTKRGESLLREREQEVISCSKPIYRWSLLHHRSVLRNLTIENCSLYTLLGDDCDDSNSQPEYLGHLASLQELKIVSCKDVKHLRRVIQKLTSLKSLHLSVCKDLDELPEVLGDLTSLEMLSIDRCRNIKALPESIGKLTNLEHLYILDCPSLKRWCEDKKNKERLGHVRPEYELPKTSKPGEQPKPS